MARRPVFLLNDQAPHFAEQYIDFVYYSGFADSQRKKSAASLHMEYMILHPDDAILEVSRFSENVLGQRLSAFNLLGYTPDGRKVPVENLFQSSKVFEHGGPYTDLLFVPPAAAKKDLRLKSSGALIGFQLCGEEFPTEPKTFFYDWIYINALKNYHDITEELLHFNAFTDIVFNPDKSINCQARTIAIYVSLCKEEILEKCLRSKETFAELVYGTQSDPEQLTFF